MYSGMVDIKSIAMHVFTTYSCGGYHFFPSKCFSVTLVSTHTVGATVGVVETVSTFLAAPMVIDWTPILLQVDLLELQSKTEAFIMLCIVVNVGL